MEFFHAPVQIISRQNGRSAVAAAAYRSGTRLECTWDGRIHDYTRKQHIIYSEIMLPPQAPQRHPRCLPDKKHSVLQEELKLMLERKWLHLLNVRVTVM